MFLIAPTLCSMARKALAAVLLCCMAMLSVVAGAPESVLRTACNAYTDNLSAYVGGSCWVRVTAGGSITYAAAINTCSALILATGITNGRLANIAQKRSIMKVLRAKWAGLMNDKSMWISLAQVPNTGEPKGIWEICVDAAQTDCFQLPSDALPWYFTGVPDGGLSNNHHHAFTNFGGNLFFTVDGVASWDGTDATLYALCEFPSDEQRQQKQYELAATGYKAPLIAQIPVSLPPRNPLFCVKECYRTPGCISYAFNPTTNECALQYIRYADVDYFDLSQPQAAPGWVWYEEKYYE